MSTNSQEEEATWISTKIMDLAQSIDYRKIAILYRSNYLSRAIEKSLLMNGIPYVIYGGIRFYDRAEIKDTMSYLRMLVTADDLSFLRTINTPKRGLGDKAVQQIIEKSIEENCSLYEAAKNHQIFSGSNQLKVRAYVELIETLKLKAETETLEDLISSILDLSGMRRSFEDNHEQDRLENVKELISDASSFIKMFPDATLEDYLETVALYGDKNEIINNAVSLMTIHASKGLEFDYVFIASMNEGVFPNDRAMSEGKRGIEEERRLAYVAMTRARQRLFISDAQGFSYVLGKAQTASRFIDEIDSEVIEHHRISSYGQVIQATPKEELQAYLRGQEATIASHSTKKTKYKKGDVILHTSFGEGIIISIDDGFANVAFNHPFGMKKLVLSHPSIMKKEKTYGA
ncbi:MAG: ATP-binding domain-containing protein [Erysipelothrix sp.]|nr:ATP-binding domain-containing protein [Erysipelothrix sp.]